MSGPGARIFGSKGGQKINLVRKYEDNVCFSYPADFFFFSFSRIIKITLYRHLRRRCSEDVRSITSHAEVGVSS